MAELLHGWVPTDVGFPVDLNDPNVFYPLAQSWAESPTQAEIQQAMDIAQMQAEAEEMQAKNLEYYENWKAQEQAYYEATGEYGHANVYDVWAETILDTHDYLKGSGEYLVEETLDLPEDIIEATATPIAAAAAPLEALTSPLSGLGIALAAVAGLLLLRKA
jgi:hypothetical protein